MFRNLSEFLNPLPSLGRWCREGRQWKSFWIDYNQEAKPREQRAKWANCIWRWCRRRQQRQKWQQRQQTNDDDTHTHRRCLESETTMRSMPRHTAHSYKKMSILDTLYFCKQKLPLFLLYGTKWLKLISYQTTNASPLAQCWQQIQTIIISHLFSNIYSYLHLLLVFRCWVIDLKIVISGVRFCRKTTMEKSCAVQETQFAVWYCIFNFFSVWICTEMLLLYIYIFCILLSARYRGLSPISSCSIFAHFRHARKRREI